MDFTFFTPYFPYVLAFFPAIVWVIFFLREDVHPEPKRAITYAFVMGGLISIPVLGSQILFQKFSISFVNSTLFLVVGLAFIEELFKFLGIRLAVGKRSFFDEPIDAMIYMIVGSLGFATVENIFIASSSVSDFSSLESIVDMLLLRFIGATFLHALASGLIGYYWAKAKEERKSDFAHFGKGLTLATVVHSLFNYLVLRFQDSNLVYASVFLVAISFLLFKDFDEIQEDEETSVIQP